MSSGPTSSGASEQTAERQKAQQTAPQQTPQQQVAKQRNARQRNAQSQTAARWAQLYHQTPLCDVPYHFGGIAQSPFMQQYLRTILRLCPDGGRTLETGVGSGYGAIWLSLRGIYAEGLDYVPALVERAGQINAILGGSAHFRLGDLFELYPFRSDSAPEHTTEDTASALPVPERYHVIHHQGVLEHLTVPGIHAALAQQVALADYVVFSVPSAYYPFDPEFGDERLLPLEEWKRILAPFDVAELRLYGDPQHGEREHLLAVLRGQNLTLELRRLMQVPDEAYPPGISAIVHTRNEAGRIEECLRSLQGWTDEIIVCDMESSDDTVEIARRFTENIVYHPHITNFDRARNVSAMRARYRWVFYLDADERVPPGLGPALHEIIRSEEAATAQGQETFAGLLVPFRHHFAGQWMRCLYPGYTAPRLLKNGRFTFNARLHSGTQVDGPISYFPADDPELALVHYSFDSLSHYLDKLNRYTDGEAANLYRDGQAYSWQSAMRHFVHDFRSYYDYGDAKQDGVHGFLYSFLSAFYRFEQHAKLYELRYRQGQLQPPEQAVPQSVEEVLEYALGVLREKPPLQAPEIKVIAPIQDSAGMMTEVGAFPADTAKSRPETQNESNRDLDVKAIDIASAQVENVSLVVAPPNNTGEGTFSQTQAVRQAQAADVVWSGPLHDPSGYGEESRNFVLALDGAGAKVSGHVIPWSHDRVELAAEEAKGLEELEGRAAASGFVHVTQNFPTSFGRHAQASVAVGRTMFETDRLPPDWVQACNRMDRIWVPSEFNRQTFADAGVEASKLTVIPGCFDPAPLQRAIARKELLHSWNDETREILGDISISNSSDFQAIEHLHRDGTTFSHNRSFAFLSVFDWTLHKGWDVLLRSFLRAFENRDDVCLLLKVWSTMGYSAEQIRAQAVELARRELGHDLVSDGRVRFLTQKMPRLGLQALYQTCDAFVLPSRGEGWGRPYMEAMACGKPTIGTAWSGNTAFMTSRNSFLTQCTVEDVPDYGWRQIPTYRGHRWAEPNGEHLQELLIQVAGGGEDVAQISKRGQEEVTSRFSRQAVGPRIIEEIEHLRSLYAPAVQMTVQTAMSQAEGSPPQVDPPQVDPIEEPETVEPVRVRWEGAQFSRHSLGYVNRELCLGMIEDLQGGGIDDTEECSSRSASAPIELSLVPTEPNHFGPEEESRFAALAERFFRPLFAPADVHVRHFFPPRLEVPSEGRFVLIQPWEYGYLPQRWIEPIQQNVDEVWCYSEYVRDVYLASGISPEKLQVVPLGVDTTIFRPGAPPYVFTTEPGASALQSMRQRLKGETDSNTETTRDSEAARPFEERPFVFLFAGGTLHRKGIDILLQAYQKAFTTLDDVCLVIKDTGTNTVYRGQNEGEHILSQIQKREHDVANGQESGTASLVYLHEDLTPHQLAGVYTACDCLVQPYRGEGFCLPALEAMACGVPVVVPAGGPTDDFIDESVGWRLRAEKKPFAITPFGKGKIGEWDCSGPTWMFEIAVDDLARQLRRIYSNRAEAQRKGQAAAARVREGWTWRKSSEVVRQRLDALSRMPLQQRVPKRLAQQAVVSLVTHSTLVTPLTDSSEMAQSGAISDKTSLGNGVGMGIVYSESNTILSGAGLSRKPAQQTASRKRPTISLCMIAKNEERVIGDCLQSIKPWVDEMILVDTGSEDRTVEIAREHGSIVHNFPWCDDFSAARNESLKYATGDWLFWMDADDTIPPECGQKLRELAENAEARITGFLVQVHIPPADGVSGWTIVDHVKLFRNLPGLRFEGRIHEQILEPIHRMGGMVERSDAYVVHSGYDYSPEGQERKRHRDFTLLAKDLEDRPDHPFVLFNIGMTAYYLKDYSKAVSTFERCLQVSQPQESTVRKVYAMLTGCYQEQGQWERAREVVEQGLSLHPHDPELLFRSGVVYRELKRPDLAEQSYVKLLTHRETGHIDSIDVTITGHKAHHNLALVYQDLGRFDQAEQQWQLAIQTGPKFPPSWMGLGELLTAMGRFDHAYSVAQQLGQFEPELGRQLHVNVQQVELRARSAKSSTLPVDANAVDAYAATV